MDPPHVWGRIEGGGGQKQRHQWQDQRRQQVKKTNRTRVTRVENRETKPIGVFKGRGNAVQFGSALLIENLPEYVDPVLNPVLQKKIVLIGNNPHLQIGDSQVPYDSNFKLYLTTKLPNPHYSPDICVMLTLLNFQATMNGLSDQMLGLCVKMEAPDLEKQSEHLLLEDAQNKGKK